VELCVTPSALEHHKTAWSKQRQCPRLRDRCHENAFTAIGEAKLERELAGGVKGYASAVLTAGAVQRFQTTDGAKVVHQWVVVDLEQIARPRDQREQAVGVGHPDAIIICGNHAPCTLEQTSLERDLPRVVEHEVVLHVAEHPSVMQTTPSKSAIMFLGASVIIFAILSITAMAWRLTGLKTFVDTLLDVGGELT
jgi:hypothetical protein